ncbi:hypothetical protein [Arthrobacter sp. H5]|uniref:hypothetical protein n=1 Tax=Arthrobacter sp. H5 TaxID=1267973 RepID=UPI0012DC96B1|nr:hypothetical protein [Arthrobacter sp. H5]
MDDERKLALEAMAAEASRLGDAIAERHAAAERFIAVAGTLAGVGLTLGLAEGQKPILIALPVGIAIIMLYMMQIYTDAGMHSGHREALELHLEDELGQTVLVGQTHVAKKHARRPSVGLTSGLVAICWIGTVVLGGRTVLTWDATSGPGKEGYIWVFGLIVAFAIFVMCRAFNENRFAEANAIAAARGAWSKQEPQ